VREGGNHFFRTNCVGGKRSRKLWGLWGRFADAFGVCDFLEVVLRSLESQGVKRNDCVGRLDGGRRATAGGRYAIEVGVWLWDVLTLFLLGRRSEILPLLGLFS